MNEWLVFVITRVTARAFDSHGKDSEKGDVLWRLVVRTPRWRAQADRSRYERRAAAAGDVQSPVIAKSVRRTINDDEATDFRRWLASQSLRVVEVVCL